jgi:hypothetical protein
MRARSVAAGFTWLVLAGILAFPSRAEALDQWKRWEQSIESSYNFAASGNPYRDLILRIRFTQRGTGATFTQDAFWDTGTTFKVRSAFTPGTWDWQIASCQGTTGGQNCAAGVSWTPSSGTVTVTAKTNSGIRLYDRGFPAQLAFVTGGGDFGFSQIKYWDRSEDFYWAGDSAWAAPPREISGQTADWLTFLNDRKAKGFTVVLIAPSVAWSGLPAAAGFSFDQGAGCTGIPIPNDCSKPRPQYWNAFDNLVQQATARDLVVVVAGTIDPVRLAGDLTYPNQANALDFSRYMAARLAGNAVIFAPGFDSKVNDRTQNGARTVKEVMNAAGAALREAAPLQLVTNHLSGPATCPEYADFRDDGWMSFYMFHSGHAFNDNGTPGTQCAGRTPGEPRVQAALRRAREMPLTLKTYNNASMPSVNGEGPYDAYPLTTDPVDNPYRVRQAGHVSSLSNALGFTYGMTSLGRWEQPSTLFSRPSSSHMQQLAARFRGRAGLPARHEWIDYGGNVPTDDLKMVLASDSSSLVLAYLPGDPSRPSIKINTGSVPVLICGGTWTMKWFDAPSNVLLPSPAVAPCAQGVNQITLKKPDCPPTNPDCDAVLEIQRTGSALASPSRGLPNELLELWVDLSSGDGTSAIYGRVADPLSQFNRLLLISPAGMAFQQSPRVTRNGAGYFVVWHAEGLDGSLYGIYAQQLDHEGHSVGPQFQVNLYGEHDQRDPAVASDSSGNVVVVWSSYGQDGDLGGIFGRKFDSSGNPVTSEFTISSTSLGHQSMPQISVDALGNFAVAWNTKAGEDLRSAVSARKFNAKGEPLTDEVRIDSRGDAFVQLVDLQMSSPGDFSVRWMVQDLQGNAQGQRLQQFDATSRRLGPEVPILE